MPSSAVHAPPSRFAVWASLETKADRWASYAALCLGLVGLVAVVFL